MSESFGPEWVEAVMDKLRAVAPIDTSRNRGTKEQPDFRDPYNRIYEAVARCPDRRTAERLVQAVIDYYAERQ